MKNNIILLLCFMPLLAICQTQTRNDAALQGDQGAVSGFFETSTPINYPAGANSWWHLLDIRHSNLTNNYTMQFAGSFFDQNLYFRKTNGNGNQLWNRVVIENTDGKVGIGTSAPRSFFDVSSIINDQKLGSVFGRLLEGNDAGDGTYLGVRGYGTQMSQYNGKSFALEHGFYGSINISVNFFRGSGTTGGEISFSTNNNTERLRIKDNGYVGIGTINPSDMLTVAGKIGAREIKVATNAGADFVFSDNYPLYDLTTLEHFVRVNKHLPEIASASEMIEKGISLGELNIKLLQKIEELTLHLIQKDKEIKFLKKDLEKSKVDFQVNMETINTQLKALETKINNYKP